MATAQERAWLAISGQSADDRRGVGDDTRDLAALVQATSNRHSDGRRRRDGDDLDSRHSGQSSSKRSRVSGSREPDRGRANEEKNFLNDELGVGIDPTAPAVPCSLHNNEWMDTEERDVIDWDPERAVIDREYCFICKYGQTAEDAERQPRFSGLLAIINKEYGRNNNQEVCRLVQNYYNKHLRGCTDDHKPWARISIYHCITRHKPNALTNTIEDIHTTNAFLDVLRDKGMCVYDPVSKCKQVVEKGALLFERFVKLRSRLMHDLMRCESAKPSSRT